MHVPHPPSPANRRPVAAQELAGQGAAVEAAAKLDEALAGDKGGSSAIKSALAKAEAALAAAPGGTAAACGFQLGVELLAPRIQVGRAALCAQHAALISSSVHNMTLSLSSGFTKAAV